MSEISIPDETKALYAALAAAQGEFPAITKAKTVDVRTREGPGYSYSYASLDEIIAAVRPILSKHGIAVLQPLENPGGVPSISTELLHKDGGRIARSFPLYEIPTSPQQFGSKLTYLRRYLLCAFLGIAPGGEDDDAQAAEVPPPTQFRAPAEIDKGAADDITPRQKTAISTIKAKLLEAGAITEADWDLVLSHEFDTDSIRNLTRSQASDLIERLKTKEKDLEREQEAHE